MSAFVVDVNVPIVANGRETHADLDCQKASISALLKIVQTEMVVLDDQMQILEQYRRCLNPSGQPGVGDAFMQWIWENQAVAERCEQVSLTVSANGFVQFPDDPDLNQFDLADRIFVAAARASRNNPEILNAVDSDWWEHRDALVQNGLRVSFLCPQHMSP
jgi:hypothetical protein